jgi:hypothetical protein
MPRPVPKPGGAARTFVVAIASGLLVIGLALEVAVASLDNREPAYVPGSCADEGPALPGSPAGCQP